MGGVVKLNLRPTIRAVENARLGQVLIGKCQIQPLLVIQFPRLACASSQPDRLCRAAMIADQILGAWTKPHVGPTGIARKTMLFSMVQQVVGAHGQ